MVHLRHPGSVKKAREGAKMHNIDEDNPDRMFDGVLDQSVTNIFEYSNIRIFLIRIFIRTFVRIIFCIRIYSDIRSYRNFVTNIFGYSFVSKF